MPQPNSTWLTHAGMNPPAELKLESEYHAPYAAWKAKPTPAASGAFLKSLEPVIARGIKQYGSKSSGPLLHSRARGITLDALGRYDPAKGPLRPHVMNALQGLQRYDAQSTQMLSVPERVVLEKMHLASAEQELSDRHGRDPSDAELVDHTGLSPARIGHLRRYKGGFAEGQLTAAGQGSEEDDEAGGDVAVERPDPMAAKVALIYHELDPINQAIVEHGFGLNGRPKLRTGKIAQRLNLSQGAISQRAARIQDLLDQVDRAHIL